MLAEIGEEFINNLLQGDDGEGKQAWSEFLFNVPLARSFLEKVPKETTTACLNQGHKWSGSGWTTSRASRVVYELTGVPLVTSRVEHYRNAFLYAIAMAKEVEILELDLPDRASEVAYNLCAILCDPNWPYPEQPAPGDPAGVAQKEEEDAKAEAEIAGLEWDEQTEELPKELKFIYDQVLAGKRKLELRSVLECLPKFSELPARAPENNFRKDGQRSQDRTVKTWQQSLLHILRMQAVLYLGVQNGADPKEIETLQQQQFQLACEMYCKMSNWRKEASVPGCVPTGETVLFEKEEMQTVTQMNKVNQMARGKGTQQVFTNKIISSPHTGFHSSSTKGKGFTPYSQNPYGRGRSYSMSFKESQGGIKPISSGMAPRFYRGPGWPRKGGNPTYTKGGTKGRSMYSIQKLRKHLTTFSQAETESAMVAKAWCLKRHPYYYSPWHSSNPRGSIRFKQPYNLSLGKIPGRDCPGRISANQLLGSRCSTKTANPLEQAPLRVLQKQRHSLLGALVCNFQNRGGRNKVKTNFRLQKNKYPPVLQPIQDGKLGTHLPLLSPKMWACKIDLKDAFFHLSLSSELQKYVNLKVGQNIYKFLAAPFGLNILPELWTKTMKVLQKLWRTRGILCFLYLDDILIVNKNKLTLKTELEYMLQTLEAAGLQINSKKSILQPTQVIDHLGFQIDFGKGVLTVPPAKLKSIRKDLGKIVLAKSMTARKMAAILGQVRSFLQAIPALRSFTDLMLGFIRNNQLQGWDKACPIPEIMKEELKTIGKLLTDWPGRSFGKQTPKREIHSDSSDFCWGGKISKLGR